jgi:hypothetical protein
MSADPAAPVNLEPVLTLEPGRYRARVSRHGAVTGVHDITYIVVS